jgi:HK97 family phage major capsid protein
MQGKYEDQYASELIQGDSASGELPGVTTDFLDLDNSNAEALVADLIRDANTFGAVITGEADTLGTDPYKAFNALVASLPAKLRADATVTMHPDTLEAYSNVKGTDGQPVFKITPTTFENYPLSLDDNFNSLGDVNKAVVAFGNADKALSMGNIDLKLQENPYQVDGVTLFTHAGLVGLTVRDNLALRFLLAKA